MALGKVYHSVKSTNRQEHPVHILEVIGNASFGGMERYITNFLTHLPVNDFKITCICPYESAYTTSLRDLGFNVYITPITDDPIWRSIQFTVEIAHLHKIDLFHAHMPKAHTLAALAGCLIHKPVVSTVHGMHLSSYEFGVSRLSGSHLITNCHEAYGQALGLGLPAEKVSIIHNGVDVQLFKPGKSENKLRKMIGMSEDVPLIGFVGRLAYEKGPDLFLRIAQQIHYSKPKIHFAVVGQGDMKDELKQMCVLLGLENHVHFIGWQNSMADIYTGFDLLVYTSRSDGTSLVLLEAMASGCPVVALDVGGVREVVENDNTGVLAPPNDWEDAQFKALQLLANPDRLGSMGIAGRYCVEKKFDLNVKTQLTADLLRQIAFRGINGQMVLNNTTIMSSGNGKGNGISIDSSSTEAK